jgi:molecular chaperone GrpE (heat shock protein)
MGHVSELRANVHKQFQTTQDILDIAKDLNAIRLRLESEGRTADADATKQSITRLLDHTDKLAGYARSNGQFVVDALRDAW